MRPPLRVSYLALLSEWTDRERELRHVAELAEDFAAPPPAPGSNHYRGDFETFRFKWERHTEFTRYKFIVPGAPGDDPFAKPAIGVVPKSWIAALPGRTIMAAHVAHLPLAGGAAEPDHEALSGRLFAGNALVGAGIAGGVAQALTDFRIHADGFSRYLVLDGGMSSRQAGRMVQRLLEMETYRALALLALPVARELMPTLAARERELVRITTALASAGEADEPVLLDRLTRLEAEIERRAADNHSRFSAADAYHELVQRRIAELREARLPGIQNFEEFTERRLAPAMRTCRAAARRQDVLSERVARAVQLLSTRVDVTRERQTQAVLESMDRRARLQLRLQETVEGLSVAAITYYIVGLVGYGADALEAAALPVDPVLVTGLSIPVVAIVVALSVRKVRERVTRAAG
jgi:uncharacterized membrane-anchored protein